jgi:uncharacterized protein YrrD
MISTKQVLGKPIDAQDGHIGSVHDLYFDEQTWSVRYLVVDTGKWLPGRKVLVVPDAILKPWHGEAAVPVNLTKEQIKSSPDIDTAQPVSRLAEELLHQHYGWNPYWHATGMLAMPAPPPLTAASEEERREAAAEAESSSDTHLRSAKEVRGYNVQATDGKIGHVEDFVLDDDCTRITFLAIDLKGWLSRKQVLAPPRLVSRIDWASFTIYVDAAHRAIEAGQEYKPAA